MMFPRNSRYRLNLVFSTLLLSTAMAGVSAHATGRNVAKYAQATTSFVSGHETIAALNDGFTPANSNDKSHGAYGNWPQQGTRHGCKVATRPPLGGTGPGRRVAMSHHPPSGNSVTLILRIEAAQTASKSQETFSPS